MNAPSELDYPPSPPAALSPRIGHTGSRLARMPLRLRLVAIVCLILVVGLGVSAILTTTILERFLIAQVDAQLEAAAQQLSPGTKPLGENGGIVDSGLPSDFAFLALTGDGQLATWTAQRKTIQQYGAPNLTPYTFAGSTSGSTTPAFIDSTPIDANSGSSRWRVLEFSCRAYAADSSLVPAVCYVMLPIESVDHTVTQIGRILLLSAAFLVLIGAMAGYAAIRRSLRPLGMIERTAAAIAAGDLSQRVPPAPASTEVGSLANSLNTMLSQIEQAFDVREASEARMRRFVSDASHELRTPLATVRGYGELYRMGALKTSEAMDDTMRRIEDSAKRMGTLVNDLLALARLDEGRPVRMEPVDLAALARDACSDLHALDHTRTTAVTGLDGTSAPISLLVAGDEDQLRQVFTNLVGNAVQHTPAGTPAEIALGRTNVNGQECVLVEVRDHGPGISAEQAERVFERFFRVDSSRNRSSGGSGLGMAIVEAIISAHHGSVAVTPTEGGGLTVRIVLPVAPPRELVPESDGTVL